MMKSSRKPKNPKRQKRSKLKIALLSFTSLIVLLLIGLGIFVGIAAAGTPKWDPSTLSDPNQTSHLLDMNNTQYAQLSGTENRQLVTSAQIPDLVKKTFVAVEDKRFYQHFGIDPIRIIGSALNDLRSGSANEGASTITVQLARNAFIANPSAKTLTRKIQEAVLAIQLEHEYTKDEILTFYLNKIPLGQSSYGIEAAAQTYFGKDIGKLTPVEVALLAGLPQAPSGYNPYVHPEAAKNRRTIVLGVMRDAGIISAADYTKDKDAPFTYVDTMEKNYGGALKTGLTNPGNKYPYFVDYVVEELESTYNLTPDQIYNGGLQIYTTVNPKIQDALETAFANPANFPKAYDNKKQIEGAMTIIDPSTGAIQAMVGGRNYQAGGFNRAWEAKRMPGSTIKPLVVYGPAIEKGGYFPGTVLDDEPVTFNTGGGKYSPTDFDTISRGWKGLITMRYALEDSVNVYAVKLLNLIGIDYGWSFGKNNLGLPLEEKDKVLSLALGTPGLSTKDMTAAYGIYANNGVSVTNHVVVKVIDSKGNIVIAPKITSNRVMKETTAYMVNNLLRSVVTSGTGTSAQIGNWAIAGKTGTSSLPDNLMNRTGNTDAWFAGYTSKYAGVIWMGYDSNPDLDTKGTPGPYYLRSVYGGSYPASIWKQVMTVALQGQTVQTQFPQPAGIVNVTFDSKSGLLPSSLTPPQFVKTEIAVQGSIPTKISDVWIQKNVDADNPTMLATPNTLHPIAKTFLNLPDRDPSWPWPASEAPYKPPTQFAPDPIVQNPPPSQGASLPTPTLTQVQYDVTDPNKPKAILAMTVPQGNEQDSTIIYLQRPGQAALESFPINASNAQSTSISISLVEKGKPPVPGNYVFWAAFQNMDGSGVGPISQTITLSIP